MGIKSLLLVFALLGVALSASYPNFTDVTNTFSSQVPEGLNFSIGTGYIPINWNYPMSVNPYMFYTMITAQGTNFQRAAGQIPIIIWLQGGPGSSSQFGLWTEIGPLTINYGPNNSTVFGWKSYPWNVNAHLLVIDQPLGVGFSNIDGIIINNTLQASADFQNFIYNFYQVWPQLVQNPLYIFGESFAGHYIPSHATKLVLNSSMSWLNLKGVGIGDGWTDPINQVGFYDSYLYSAGIIGNQRRANISSQEAQAVVYEINGNYSNACGIFNVITGDDYVNKIYGKIDIYNYRYYGSPISNAYSQWLSQNAAAYTGNPNAKYVDGSNDMYNAFTADIAVSFAEDVVKLLRKIRVLLYNGQDDIIVNTAGAINWINQMEWEHIQSWRNNPKTTWTLNGGNVVGWVKQYGTLTFALVNKAGHMVPYDQPQAGWDMLTHFLRNDPTSSWQS